ncbi:MAG: hypothetical protein V3U76_17100 [Granulosicoccus sp.]
MQLVGSYDQDDRLLRTARWLPQLLNPDGDQEQRATADTSPEKLVIAPANTSKITSTGTANITGEKHP